MFREHIYSIIIFLIGFIPVAVSGACPADPDMFSNSESERITIEEKEIDGVLNHYFIKLPSRHNGEALDSAFLIIGNYLAMEGMIPLMVEATGDGNMAWASLYPDFDNGAYIRATYGKCNVLGKTVKVRSKLPKMIMPGGEN